MRSRPLAASILLVVALSGCADPSARQTEMQAWLREHEVDGTLGGMGGLAKPDAQDDGEVRVEFGETVTLDSIGLECFGDGELDLVLSIGTMASSATMTFATIDCGDGVQHFSIGRSGIVTVGATVYVDEDTAWSLGLDGE